MKSAVLSDGAFLSFLFLCLFCQPRHQDPGAGSREKNQGGRRQGLEVRGTMGNSGLPTPTPRPFLFNAELTGRSLASVKRDWTYARAWLYDYMK